MHFHSFLTISCTDFKIGQGKYTHSAELRMQQTLMKQFIQPAALLAFKNSYDHMYDAYFMDNDSDSRDVCTWHGAMCASTGDLIQLVIKADPSMLPMLADIRWAPPKVERLVLRGVTLFNGWQSRHLPCALKFFSIQNCPYLWEAKKIQKAIDLSHLPQSLEELRIIGGNFSGTICIEALPKTLSILFIHCSNYARAFVKIENLPEFRSLACEIRAPSKPAQVIVVGAVREDRRVGKMMSQGQMMSLSRFAYLM